MRMRLVYRFIPLLLLPVLLCSCMTADFSSVNTSVIRGDYAEARRVVESQKDSLYSENDKVLYNLDAGLLSHYSGDWNQSNKNFTQAENLIEEYYSKSISQGVSSYFVNDMVVDYSGEDYEDIYTNFFMALNYIQLGKFEDAMVEIRRFDNKQKLLTTKYASQMEYAESELGSGYSNVSLQFQNSAAARYLSMLLYRANGQQDSAEVDRRLLLKAFNEQPALYDFRVPSCVDEELSVPKGKARLNFVCFTGQAPIKVEDVSRYDVGDGVYTKIAVPMMVDRGSAVYTISVDVYDGFGNAVIPVETVSEPVVEVAPETTAPASRSSAARARALAMGIGAEDSSAVDSAGSGTTFVGLGGTSSNYVPTGDALYTTWLEKIESIENIALDTFSQHASVIYSRAMIRALGKTLKTGALSLASELTDDSSLSLLFSVLSFASQVTDEITEQADLRTSRFFPAYIYVGGITLDPGDYTIVISFKGNGGLVLSSNVYENVKVTAKSVNIVEAICSR